MGRSIGLLDSAESATPSPPAPYHLRTSRQNSGLSHKIRYSYIRPRRCVAFFGSARVASFHFGNGSEPVWKAGSEKWSSMLNWIGCSDARLRNSIVAVRSMSAKDYERYVRSLLGCGGLHGSRGGGAGYRLRLRRGFRGTAPAMRGNRRRHCRFDQSRNLSR